MKFSKLASSGKGRYKGPAMLALVCAAGLGSLLPFWLAAQAPSLEGNFRIGAVILVAVLFLMSLTIRQIAADRHRIAESEQRFRRAMQDAAIGLAIVDLDGRIQETNPAFAAMLGYTAAELEAMTLFQITHPDDLLIGRETMAQVRAGKVDSYRFEKRYLRKDGVPIWARLAGSLIRDEDTGSPLYLVSQIEDIDTRKKSEARVIEAETRWNFALASAGQGVWDVDMRKGGVTYSATWKSMLGYESQDLDGDPDLWLKLVHPDDLGRVKAADQAHTEGRTPYFEAEFRMRHKSGRWIWILDRGRAIERDENGQLIRAIGSLTDITRRKEAEERLKESAALLSDEKERLRVTLQSIGDAVICTDAANRITFMNPVAEKLTCVPAAEALGKTLGHVYWAVDEESGHRLGIARPSGGVSAGIDQNSRAVLVRRDDTRCSIRQVVSPIINERHEFCGSVIVFQDFTDARTLQRQLAYAAAHDALTGLANRSSFIRTMEELVEKAPETGVEHQLMFIDLDRFKLVNDTAGHAAGDALLRKVAETVRRTLDPESIVARLGGDEFAVVMKQATLAKAGTMADAIVEAIGSLKFDWEGRAHTIGASIGLTPFRAGSGLVDDIIARADAACYAAKAAGRGCASIAEPAQERNDAPPPKIAVA